jgi:hypothetical protein
MALAILDGTQTATTLSTILSSGQHITAHTVVSLGTQAITDMRGAVSGSVVSVSSLPAITGTVTVGNSVTIGSLPAISGTVTVGAGTAIIGNIDGVNTVLAVQDGSGNVFGYDRNFPVDIITALPAGTNRIGVVTIGAGTVTIGAGTAEIGTVKPAKNQSGNAQFLSVDDGSGKLFTSTLLTAGTAQIGSVTASISNSVTIASLPAISGTVTANTFALQGTAVTTSNFTSTTASTALANYNATREVLTIFNEGAGNLHICAGATCTTIAYQVRLSAGDYYEVPNHQTTITHSAVFATAGTARVTQVS